MKTERLNTAHKLRTSAHEDLGAAYQAVLFTMVDPVARATRPDDPLELVSLDPNKLLNPFVTPKLQTASRKESSLGEGIRWSQIEFLGTSDPVTVPAIN
jgi:hypothetical protein